MKNTKNTSLILLSIVFLIDMIIFNFISLLFREEGMNIKGFIFISNIIYFSVINIIHPVVHLRKASPEMIFNKVFKTILLYGIILYIGLRLMYVKYDTLLWWVSYLSTLYMCILISRLFSRKILKHLRRMGRNTRYIIFLGSGQNMDDLWKELLEDTSYGYRAIGYFDDKINISWEGKIKYLGSTNNIIPYINKHSKEIDELYCALPSSYSNLIIDVVQICENNIIRFFSVPNVRNYLRRKMNLHLVGDVPVLYIYNEPLERIDNRIKKRLFDIVFSSLFLICLFPLIFIIVAIIMKITMPGPIFFSQKRNGKDGNVFNCYKFRSMKVNDECDRVQATKNDPRKTKFGNFMRKTNIDELPQFINVLLGDMSIVGPRPHMLKHTEMYRKLISTYMIRHLAKPGITGWAQVKGFRGETKEIWQMKARVKADIWYIENWSFWLDIRIMYMTVRNIIKGEKNAY